MYVTFVYYLFVTISKRNAMSLIRNEATNIFFLVSLRDMTNFKQNRI